MNTQTSYDAYRQASQTVSKTRQIVMLYDGIIRFVRQAKEAASAGEIEARYHLLIRASDIVIGLQSCLDFEHDHDTATSLFDFYSEIDRRLMHLQRSQTDEAFDAMLEDIKQMRDAWDEIDHASAELQHAAPAAKPHYERPHDSYEALSNSITA